MHIKHYFRYSRRFRFYVVSLARLAPSSIICRSRSRFPVRVNVYKKSSHRVQHRHTLPEPHAARVAQGFRPGRPHAPLRGLLAPAVQAPSADLQAVGGQNAVRSFGGVRRLRGVRAGRRPVALALARRLARVATIFGGLAVLQVRAIAA